MLRYKRKLHVVSHLNIGGNVVYDQVTISQHIVQYFSNLFEEDNHADVDIVEIEANIDSVIDDYHNALLTKIPDEDEITATIFGMDASSSPGPDGFSGKFFHHCWGIIKEDIFRAVRTFFQKSYLPNGCNSSRLVLLPKKDEVQSVTDLRPIVLSNFFYKIIPKILATRLSVVSARYVTANQFGFISGRSIHDCIMLGSEGMNCMRRTGGGINMACKIDITKAFDTLRWDFLLKVLRVGGYDSKFVRWIEIILRSARLSILYNSSSHGYFACSRGVRQGDPLSPILFGIAEDVLSSLFHNCVASGHLVPMSMRRGSLFPTHILYADDILVFCKATVDNAATIRNILHFYGSISGQNYSPAKSNIFFSDKVSQSLRRAIEHHLDFRMGALPFQYLGVPLFVGWPRSLLKELDAHCRNFIWTGNAQKKPNCTVAWARICAIKEEGGYLTPFGQTKAVSAPSSIWMSLRSEIPQLISDTYCSVGNGQLVNFWTDDWLGFLMADKCGVPHFMRDFLTQSVAEYFYDGIWHFTQSFADTFPEIVCKILLAPVGDDSDIRYWKPSLHGNVTSAFAFSHHCHRFPKVKWGTWLWEKHIPVVKVDFLDMENNFTKLGSMQNSFDDLLVVKKIGVRPRASPPPDFINVYWWPPVNNWIKVNTDGSALGAPGKIGAGGVFRDKFSWVRGCFHVKGGIGFALEAELLAVITAIQIAHARHWRQLWIESDSTYIVHLLHERSTSVPWRFAAVWKKILLLLKDFQIQISHIYREGNKVADILAADERHEGWWPHEIESYSDRRSANPATARHGGRHHERSTIVVFIGFTLTTPGQHNLENPPPATPTEQQKEEEMEAIGEEGGGRENGGDGSGAEAAEQQRWEAAEQQGIGGGGGRGGRAYAVIITDGAVQAMWNFMLSQLRRCFEFPWLSQVFIQAYII
ncbi:uncharacterized protein LOC130990904 [Salvia miltiorrhiza]|uniref:uncharacterized protein LOC130990904 n=1 Tax=Salvia miltiorrhiza TaxID=226208 RepID=UPI0025AD9064|nr:uncharacterized protein LOC130990904 [Salvia miltiorrhiza]